MSRRKRPVLLLAGLATPFIASLLMAGPALAAQQGVSIRWVDASPQDRPLERKFPVTGGTIAVRGGFLIRAGIRAIFAGARANPGQFKPELYLGIRNETPNTIWVDAEVADPAGEGVKRDSEDLKRGRYKAFIWGLKNVVWGRSCPLKISVYSDRERKNLIGAHTAEFDFPENMALSVEKAKDAAVSASRDGALPFVVVSGWREVEFPSVAGLRPENDAAVIAQIEKLVTHAEAVEAQQSGSQSIAALFGNERVTKELKAAGTLLEKYVERNPDDPRGLLLVARAYRVHDVLTPTVIERGVINRGDPISPGLDPQKLLDHLLELDHSNPEAYYWKARLYGYNEIKKTPDGFEKAPVDLVKAIEFAGLAVRAAPQNDLYREALVLYHVLAKRHADALEASRGFSGGSHPLYLLLSDQLKMVAPDGAVEHEGSAEFPRSTLARRGASYPFLRTKAFAVALPAEQVEAFYQKQWPGLRLHQVRKPERFDGQSAMRMLAAELEWKGDDLLPSAKKPDIGKPDRLEVIFLGVFEMRNTTEEFRQRSGVTIPVSGVYCIIVFTNTHNWDGDIPE